MSGAARDSTSYWRPRPLGRHVAGIAALMAEKKPSLTQSEAESILKSTAISMRAGSKTIFDVNAGRFVTVAWGKDATGAGMADAVKALAALTK